MEHQKKNRPSWTWRLLVSLFWSFFKIGAFTIGGGYAMIPLIQREVVSQRGWSTDEEFVDIIGLSQTVPGAIAINTSVFVGFSTAGIPGAIMATLGSSLPSFVIILIIAIFFKQFSQNPAVEAAFTGVHPAVLGLIIAAVLKIGRSVLKKWTHVALAGVLFVMGLVLNLSPVLSIIFAATVGVLLFREKGAQS